MLAGDGVGGLIPVWCLQVGADVTAEQLAAFAETEPDGRLSRDEFVRIMSSSAAE